MAKTSKRRNSTDIDNNSNNDNSKTIRKRVKKQSPQQRSSIYRGVTRHRWTGRFEAHLWDKNCWNKSQNKKGRQVYLGAYNDEEVAAHAYDLAALKYWGQNTILNFPISTYEKELSEMEGQSKEEYIGSLRRKSSGFSRGVSKYRGVARHHHNGRWEARIGRVFGNKYLYLGTYATQEEAAIAYDVAAIEHRGPNAITNFDISRYIKNNPNNHQSNFNDHIDMKNPSRASGLKLLDHSQQSSESSGTTALTANNEDMATASSALGLLLKSPKFKEMLKQVATCNGPSKQNLRRSSFPEDVQTSFDIEDPSTFADEYGTDFGEFDSFSLFPIELEN